MGEAGDFKSLRDPPQALSLKEAGFSFGPRHWLCPRLGAPTRRCLCGTTARSQARSAWSTYITPPYGLRNGGPLMTGGCAGVLRGGRESDSGKWTPGAGALKVSGRIAHQPRPMRGIGRTLCR